MRLKTALLLLIALLLAALAWKLAGEEFQQPPRRSTRYRSVGESNERPLKTKSKVREIREHSIEDCSRREKHVYGPWHVDGFYVRHYKEEWRSCPVCRRSQTRPLSK